VPAPPGARADTGRWLRFPDDLQARFGDRWFAPVDPPGFLDYEGTELVLMAWGVSWPENSESIWMPKPSD
jgi:hypothetical protein